MRTWSPRWDVPASRKFATPNFVTTNRASHQPAYPRDNADATIRRKHPAKSSVMERRD